MEKLGDWYGYKLQVKGGALTASINGRKVHETRLAVDADPWLAIFSDANQAGGVRQLKITGSPSVPEVIELSRHSTLHAWLPEYYAENVINRTQGYSEENMPIGWDKKGEEIVGTRWSQDGPPKTESILRYHRPLLEDGQLDYEFYYEPGKTLTHPALDRLVFLLDKEGVKAHWLTHGGWQIGGPSPENATAEPDTRRGAVTLKESAWNQMTLVLKGDRVTLRLNGQDIAERKLDPGNSRHFGLFHYSDETLVRVRNVRLRGEWPRQLPGAATAHK